MVRQAWTGRGIAHALHNEILSGRQEQRATLLVEPDNPTAYRAYINWGWRLRVAVLASHSHVAWQWARRGAPGGGARRAQHLPSDSWPRGYALPRNR